MFIVKQGIQLLVVNSLGGLLNFGINVTVSYKEIEPAVVVVVDKTSSKAQDVMGGARNSGLVADLVEEAFAIILPKVVGGQLKIRDVQFKPTVVL